MNSRGQFDMSIAEQINEQHKKNLQKELESEEQVDTSKDLFEKLSGIFRKDGEGLSEQLAMSQYQETGSQAYKNRYPENKSPLPEKKNAVTYLNLFHKKIPDLRDPALIQQIMEFYFDAVHGEDTAEIFAKIFGKRNIFDAPTDSKSWSSQRSDFSYHLYAVKNLTNLMPVMQEIIANYNQEIADNNGIADLGTFSARFTMDMIGKTQLGLKDFPADIKDAFTVIIDSAIKNIANPKNSMPWPVNRGVELYDKYVSGQKTLDEIMAPGFVLLGDLISRNQDTILTTPNWIRDVSIRKLWDPNKTKTNEEWEDALRKKSPEIIAALHSDAVVKDAALFIVVGHETSAKFLQFTLTFLADQKHRPVVEKIREEIKLFLKNTGKKLEHLDKSELDELVYLKAAVYESLRLRPPLPRLKGKTNRDITLGDIDFIEGPTQKENPELYAEKLKKYKAIMSDPNRDKTNDVILKKGDYFFLSVIESHLNEAAFGKDPHTFNPNRFLEEDKDTGEIKFKKFDPSQFYPFGFGKRICVGREFSVQEIMAALVEMVMRFDLTVDDPRCYQTKERFSLHAAYPMSVKATCLEPKPRLESIRPR